MRLAIADFGLRIADFKQGATRTYGRVMSLKSLLEEKRAAIVEQWLERTLESYPDQAAPFLKEEKDAFRNPVGHALAARIPALFEALLSGAQAGSLETLLDMLVRIRAVQELTPAQALGFIPALKSLLRAQLADEPRDSMVREELSDFERRIDDCLLLAFNLFVRCREAACEIRMREAQRQVYVRERLKEQVTP